MNGRGQWVCGHDAEDLGVRRSSMYRLLQTLVDRRWVRADATGSLHGIGTRALLTGTSHLDGPDVVYLANRESHAYLRTISRGGRRIPAHAGALGKALLAERADDELPIPDGPLTALAQNTHTDRAALPADLAKLMYRRSQAHPTGAEAVFRAASAPGRHVPRYRRRSRADRALAPAAVWLSPPRGREAAIPGAGSGRCSPRGNAPGSPGARARPPRRAPPALPR